MSAMLQGRCPCRRDFLLRMRHCVVMQPASTAIAMELLAPRSRNNGMMPSAQTEASPDERELSTSPCTWSPAIPSSAPQDVARVQKSRHERHRWSARCQLEETLERVGGCERTSKRHCGDRDCKQLCAPASKRYKAMSSSELGIAQSRLSVHCRFMY